MVVHLYMYLEREEEEGRERGREGGGREGGREGGRKEGGKERQRTLSLLMRALISSSVYTAAGYCALSPQILPLG